MADTKKTETKPAPIRCGHPENRGARRRYAAVKPSRGNTSSHVAFGKTRDELVLAACEEFPIGTVLVPAVAILGTEDDDAILDLGFDAENEEIPVRTRVRKAAPVVVAPSIPVARPSVRPSRFSTPVRRTSGFSPREIRSVGPAGYPGRSSFASLIAR